jgi:hypothetical protein
VVLSVTSDPSDFTHPALAPPGSLVHLFLGLREGSEEMGLEAAANYRRGECTSTRVTELFQRTSHDGKCIAWGRGIEVTVRTISYLRIERELACTHP